MKGLTKLGGKAAGAVSRGIDITGSWAKGAGEAIDEFGEDIAKNLTGNAERQLTRKGAAEVMNSQRFVNSIAGSIEGGTAGAIGGAVIGGVTGAIDEDESFIGGAAKGALLGGTLGSGIGAASGALHNDARIFNNANKDIAAAIAKFKNKQAAGVDHDNIVGFGRIYE